MKVNENETADKHGVYPCCVISGKDATPQKVQEWLFRNYQGYKFAIIFDCKKDEFEEPERETPVYFLDGILEEALYYVGFDTVKRWLEGK